MSTIQKPAGSFAADIAAWIASYPKPDREAVDEHGYPIFLDDSDGVPLETNWHYLQIGLLIECITADRHGRQDYYCAGNMFIYFNAQQARNKDYRGPDFFLVNNVPREPMRKYWAIWKESYRYPDLIVELMSPTTRDIDLTTKRSIYEKTFSTREYVTYDPDRDELQAWRKVDGVFQAIDADAQGRIFLEEAGLYFGRWQGRYRDFDNLWLRFFDRDGNLVLLDAEAEAKRANAEAQVAAAEKARADAADARAAALAAEVARLKAQLGIPS